jgi:hypothetical protein
MLKIPIQFALRATFVATLNDWRAMRNFSRNFSKFLPTSESLSQEKALSFHKWHEWLISGKLGWLAAVISIVKWGYRQSPIEL